MTYREPRDWIEFRKLLASAIANVGYDDVAAYVGDLNVEDDIIAPLYRLWEAIEFAAGEHESEGLSMWEWHEDDVYSFLVDFAESYSTSLNYAPGESPEKLDQNRFSRAVTSELIGKKYYPYNDDALDEARLRRYIRTFLKARR